MIELENGELERIDKFLERFTRGRDLVQEFLSKPEISAYLDNNKFDELYKAYRSASVYNATLLTRVLLISGIDFIDYMTSVPEDCFRGILLKSVTLPKAIKSIGWNAFLDSDVGELKYDGTIEEWRNIKILDRENIPTLEVICKDGVTRI